MSAHFQSEISSSLLSNASVPCRPRVVIVDDSQDLLDVICAVLESQHEVEIVGQAANGRGALDLVEMFQPDLVIMDIQMPLMDGLTAAAIISRRYPETRVTLMSGADSPDLRAAVKSSGAFAFIYKPEFAMAIASVLHENQ